MAIIKCPECGKDVSDTAKNCPHCGYYLSKQKDEIEKKSNYWGIIGGIVGAIIGLYACSGGF